MYNPKNKHKMKQKVTESMSNNKMLISKGYIYTPEGDRFFTQLYAFGNLQTGYLKLYNCKFYSLKWDRFKELRMAYGNSQKHVGMFFSIPKAKNKVTNPCSFVEGILNYIEFQIIK